jgi:hypothetical protein
MVRRSVDAACGTVEISGRGKVNGGSINNVTKRVMSAK